MFHVERLDRFMARSNAAYYADHDPFQDFTTAPEITQVFGELLGLWSAVVWQQQSEPAPVLLAELGPGRGTLMADAIRAIAKTAPRFAEAIQLHLIETSPRLKAQQAARLPQAVWHETVGALPPGPVILLANEFLDALPVRQFVRRGPAWTERYVEAGAYVERPAEPPPREAADGEVVEVNEPAQALVEALAARFRQQPGAALFLDYGPSQTAPGDSLQALRSGRPADPLANPGQADLTAHVDFATLAAAARAAGAQVHGPVPQGPFLASLGLFQRTGILARIQPPARAAALIQSAQRLAEPDRMGGLFKALAICSPNAPTPPGFER